MAITERVHDQLVPPGTTIRMPVELDLATVEAVRSVVADAVRDGAGTITFDCSPLTFIDAGGVGLLVWSANAAAMDGRRVRLLDPGRTLRRMLDVTGVGSRFVVDGR